MGRRKDGQWGGKRPRDKQDFWEGMRKMMGKSYKAVEIIGMRDDGGLN